MFNYTAANKKHSVEDAVAPVPAVILEKGNQLPETLTCSDGLSFHCR